MPKTPKRSHHENAVEVFGGDADLVVLKKTVAEIIKYRPDAKLLGKDTACICVQHLLDTEHLEALRWLGIQEKNIFVLGKIYSTDRNAESRFEEKFTLFKTKDYLYSPHALFREAFDKELGKFLKVVAGKLEKSTNITQIIIIDDGGACIKKLLTCPDDSPWKTIFHNRQIAAVEQTTAGLRTITEVLLDRAEKRSFEIVLVGASALKCRLESKVIAKVVAGIVGEQIRHLTERDLVTRRMKVRIGIIGLGNIGKETAKRLRDAYETVCVYDKDSANVSGFRFEDFAYKANKIDLIEGCDVIFGCTGVDTFREDISDDNKRLRIIEIFRNATRPKWFISGSSENNEFFSLLSLKNCDRTYFFNEAMHEGVAEEERGIPALRDLVFQNELGFRITIVRGGYPINFARTRGRVLISAPKRYIQLTLAGLFAGITQVLLHPPVIRTEDPLANMVILSPRMQAFIAYHFLEEVIKKDHKRVGEESLSEMYDSGDIEPFKTEQRTQDCSHYRYDLAQTRAIGEPLGSSEVLPVIGSVSEQFSFINAFKLRDLKFTFEQLYNLELRANFTEMQHKIISLKKRLKRYIKRAPREAGLFLDLSRLYSKQSKYLYFYCCRDFQKARKCLKKAKRELVSARGVLGGQRHVGLEMEECIRYRSSGSLYLQQAIYDNVDPLVDRISLLKKAVKHYVEAARRREEDDVNLIISYNRLAEVYLEWARQLDVAGEAEQIKSRLESAFDYISRSLAISTRTRVSISPYPRHHELLATRAHFYIAIYEILMKGGKIDVKRYVRFDEPAHLLRLAEQDCHSVLDAGSHDFFRADAYFVLAWINRARKVDYFRQSIIYYARKSVEAWQDVLGDCNVRHPELARANAHAEAAENFVMHEVVTDDWLYKNWVVPLYENFPELRWFTAQGVKHSQDRHCGTQEGWSVRLTGAKHPELDKTLLNFVLLNLILIGSDAAYEKFKEPQKEGSALAWNSFVQLRQLLEGLLKSNLMGLSRYELLRVLICEIALNDVGKTPSAREAAIQVVPELRGYADHDMFYGALLSQPQHIVAEILPSINMLTYEGYELLQATSDIVHLSHVCHLEGGEEMFSRFVASNEVKKEHLDFTFIAQMLDIASAAGGVTVQGSLVLTEKTYQELWATYEILEELRTKRDTAAAYFKAISQGKKRSGLDLPFVEFTTTATARLGTMMRLHGETEGKHLSRAIEDFRRHRETVWKQFCQYYGSGIRRETTPTYVPTVLCNLKGNGALGATLADKIRNAIFIGIPIITRALGAYEAANLASSATMPLNLNKIAEVAKGPDPKRTLNESIVITIDKNGEAILGAGHESSAACLPTLGMSQKL